MNHTIQFIIAVLCFTVISCKSGSVITHQDHEKLPYVSSVELEAITRGRREEIKVNSEKFKFTSHTNKETNLEKVSKTINKEQWKVILEKISTINLDEINQLKSPTNQRMYDGDLATHISITVDKKTYQSASFDKRNPPKELEELVKYLYQLKDE
ncbi:hypothetical protein [Mesonia aestuariivivens]|uniref:Lipoprotein n=1 Tax=Mesonia aestuariivivens TaxID=2796128 RepID=A0ABS6VXI1_9FLAO|nr:hypothetical protein [Mesonia aestuariivivens]MBW2960290.1 hypothetical protein [Mesonia aestuariivivens]